MFEHLNFGKFGFKTCVFKKHFISYSCILFTKFNTLRSFYNILLGFSKKKFLEIFWLGSMHFDRSKLFFDQSKLHLKFLGWFCVFRSIETNFRSIKNHIESFFFFFKTLDSHVFKHFFKNFSNSFSLYPIGQVSNQDFLSFSSVLFARFSSSKAGKTLLPFFLHWFSYFMH